MDVKTVTVLSVRLERDCVESHFQPALDEAEVERANNEVAGVRLAVASAKLHEVSRCGRCLGIKQINVEAVESCLLTTSAKCWHEYRRQ